MTIYRNRNPNRAAVAAPPPLVRQWEVWVAMVVGTLFLLLCAPLVAQAEIGPDSARAEADR